jgi:hypothetical protein
MARTQLHSPEAAWETFLTLAGWKSGLDSSGCSSRMVSAGMLSWEGMAGRCARGGAWWLLSTPRAADTAVFMRASTESHGRAGVASSAGHAAEQSPKSDPA